MGAVLAFVASGLSGKISENRRAEKQQNILYAMGVDENSDESSVNFVPTSEVEEDFTQYITKQLVVNEEGEVKEQKDAYLIDMKKQLADFRSKGDADFPLFVGTKDDKEFYVLPMYGKGLWDAIWGFMSVDKNMVVQGVYFDHKGETPGLGANIKMRFFMDDFKGESLVEGNRLVGITVAKGNNDPLNEDKEDHQVDALAGATITGNGVTAMIKETLDVYEPYLETIRAK